MLIIDFLTGRIRDSGQMKEESFFSFGNDKMY